MSTTLEYDLVVNSGGIDNGAEAVKDLGTEIKKTESAAKDLEESLKRQEARIKVIDGAINVLGGSVELAVGSISALGLVTEEQAEQFQTAALGAIAFADGAKRTFDGVKSLNEGLQAYGGAAAAARKAQAALNATLLANPWVALGVAIAAVSAALVIYYNDQVDAEEATKSGTKAIEDQIEAKKKLEEETKRLREVDAEYSKGLGDESKELQRQLNLLQAKGASEKQIFNAKKQLIQSEINDLNRRLGNISGNTELENELKNQILDATNRLDVAQAEYDRKRIEASSKAIELVKQEKTEILNYKDAVDQRNKAIKEGIEDFVKSIGGAAKQTEGVIQKALPAGPLPQLEKIPLTFAESLKKINMDLNDFFESSTGKAVGASLSAAASLSKTLADVQDSTTKEGFEKGKKFKIASVVTSALQASFEAFGAAQQFGPILGPILGAAQVAAIAIASNKAIQDIQNSSFESPGSTSVSVPSTGGGAPAAAALGGGFQNIPSGPAPTGPAAGMEPVRAYVVSSDVTNGVQAQGQIRRRRRLGPG